jgi:two-component system, OmpR family, sensor histidine kinase BaeS
MKRLQHPLGMRRSLRFKITVSFLLMTLITFTLFGILANVIFRKQFENYVIENLNQKNTGVVSTLESRYSDWSNQWDVAGLDNIGIGAMSDGLILRVSDQSGSVLWDAMVHDSGMCASMLQTMAQTMQRQNAGFDGGYTEKTYQITVRGNVVGSVAIGYYGPYFYTDNDISYLRTLNLIIVLVTVLVGAVSLVFATYMAKRLADPITRVIKTTDQISEGNYSNRLYETSNTREIVELTNAINTLAEKLEKQESLRKRLTADVAHELRTPLANLQSHIEAILDGVWEADERRLISCHEETIRLSKIVTDLEKLARLEGEGVSLNKTDIDLSALIRQVINSFEKELGSKSLTVKTALPEIHLHADGDRMTQILTNLLSNAVKYTPAGGTIALAAADENEKVRISVKDTGIGISQEDLPYIFERFYRADRSRSRDTGGSGIGLAIVKSLVTAHGGTIQAQSEPGKGSEFIILMPK